MTHPGLTALPSQDRAGGVTQALARFVEHAALQPGDRLPTERQLFFPPHRELFDAIRGRDAAAARDATTAILDIVEDDTKAMSS